MGIKLFQSNGDTTITSLAALTAVNLDSAMTGRNTAFLLKKAKTSFTWSPEDVDDAIIVVLGYGDPTVTEISAAMIRH